MKDILSIYTAQKAYYASGATQSVSGRIAALTAIRQGVLALEAEISEALFADLGKSRAEGYMSEIGMVLNELRHMIKAIPRLAHPSLVPTPLSQFHATSYALPCPYGNVLVISPWNYPFMLTLIPAIDAIAAGNTVLLKPSNHAPATSLVIQKLVTTYLPKGLAQVVLGGREENSQLLDLQFDYLFFTGGQQVGRVVAAKAAQHLTPVTLELGGKSPCIVDSSADLALAARRIVFGKYLNCGQTCVAPDYLLVEEGIKEKFLPLLIREIERQYGDRTTYGKIVNTTHFNRLIGLLQGETIAYGGSFDRQTLQIFPAILDEVPLDSGCMAQEIFGPILPILTWKNPDQVEEIIAKHPTPLALYVFTKNRDFKNRMLHIPFGGGCVNDTIIHLATSHLGFGGVGTSGMGRYHGKAGFSTFSHYKSIVDKKLWIDMPMRYHPICLLKEWLIRLFLK